MKTWMCCAVAVCGMVMASACVAPEGDDARGEADAAARGVSEGAGAAASAGAPDAMRAHEGGAATGGAVDVAPAKASGAGGSSGLVDDHDASLSERCRTPLLSVLSDARAFRLDAATLDVELTGRLHAETPGDFAFTVTDAAGVDITGRSWPEVESVEHHDDGTFTMRARAASCGDYTDAARVAVQLYDFEREWHSNTLTMDVETPAAVADGASCAALGTACGEGAWCSHARVCEAR